MTAVATSMRVTSRRLGRLLGLSLAIVLSLALFEAEIVRADVPDALQARGGGTVQGLSTQPFGDNWASLDWQSTADPGTTDVVLNRMKAAAARELHLARELEGFIDLTLENHSRIEGLSTYEEAEARRALQNAQSEAREYISRLETALQANDPMQFFESYPAVGGPPGTGPDFLGRIDRELHTAEQADTDFLVYEREADGSLRPRQEFTRIGADGSEEPVAFRPGAQENPQILRLNLSMQRVEDTMTRLSRVATSSYNEILAFANFWSEETAERARECRSPCGVGTSTAGVSNLRNFNDGILALYTPWAEPPPADPTQSRGGAPEGVEGSPWAERSGWGSQFDQSTAWGQALDSVYHLVSSDFAPGLATTFDPTGRSSLPTPGGVVVGNLAQGVPGVDQIVANGNTISGLIPPAVLAQAGVIPTFLHVHMFWQAMVPDLDLHLTGPLGAGRFHVYFASPGSLGLEPHALLEGDCVCTPTAIAPGSEVITINQAELNPGGVYRASVFNFGDQSFGNNGLSNADITMQIIQGGTVVNNAAGGNFVEGGQLLFETQPSAGAGNTWTGVEINPNTGEILDVDQYSDSANSAAVN